jgi:hypothetical protein
MKNSIDEKEKELKSQGGRSISERPILKSVALKSPCKKKKVFTASSANSNSQGLAQAWATSGPPPPPRPIHGLANAEPGMVGTGALVQNFAGASLHKLY